MSSNREALRHLTLTLSLAIAGLFWSRPTEARVIVEKTVQPGTPIYPAMNVPYRPELGERLMVNAKHVLPPDMVVQGDKVLLRVRQADVASFNTNQLSVQWSLLKAVGKAHLIVSTNNPLEAQFHADQYGTNIVEVSMTDGTREETGRAEIFVEFSTGFIVENSDSVMVPAYPGSTNFVVSDGQYPGTFCCYREQVTARNPLTGRLVTEWQVKYGSGDAASMGEAVMVSDDLGITWTNREFIFRQPNSNTGWGAIGWNPRGDNGQGEMLLWVCSHVRSPDNRMMLFRSRDNAETWQHVGDFQSQITNELGVADGYMTYFGVNRIIATHKGTLVAPMVSHRYVRVIYSRDNGKTWHNSNINDTFSQGNEDAIVETVDGGKLILLARNGVNNARRFQSTDGGVTWVDNSNAGVPTIAVNFGLARLDDPGQPYDGRIIHCAATASGAGFTGRGRMVVSINPDVSGVDKTRWDSRLLFDFTAVYSDIFYIPEDKSIYLTCESWYLGQGGADFNQAPIRFFKFSYRYWTTLPDKNGNPVPSPPPPDYTHQSGVDIGGNSDALNSSRWSERFFPMENITALSGGASHTGNPPGALTLTNTSTGGVNYTYAVIHEYTGAVYDPAIHGAISSLQWQAGVSAYSSAPFFPALVQNGTVYKRVGDHTTDHQSVGLFIEDLGSASQWEEINSNALSSTDLSLAGHHPDFSAAGAPIAFGIMQWFGSTGGSNGINIIRWATFTNFSVTLNTQASQFTIIAFGDSTTAARNVGVAHAGRPTGRSSLNSGYTGWTMVDQTSPYLYTWSDQIRDRLSFNHATVNWRVLNAGKGGSHTGYDRDHTKYNLDALSRVHSWVRSQAPQVVVIQFGINDAYMDTTDFPPGWDDPASVNYVDSRIPLEYPGVPNPGTLNAFFPTLGQIKADPLNWPRGRVTTYAENLQSLIDILQGDGARVILMTPNPISNAIQRQRLSGYAQKVRELAAADGLPLVDVWKAFDEAVAAPGNGINSYDDLLLDGMHPNPAGQTLVADRLEPVLDAVLKDNYKLWTMLEGLPAGRTAPNDMPYGDGISNFARWVFGLPTGYFSDYANLPHATGIVANQAAEYFEFKYSAIPDRVATLLPQYAVTPIGPWIDAYQGTPFGQGEIQVIHNGGETRVRVPVTKDMESLFARTLVGN